jgi:hypothetical protein
MKYGKRNSNQMFHAPECGMRDASRAAVISRLRRAWFGWLTCPAGAVPVSTVALVVAVLLAPSAHAQEASAALSYGESIERLKPMSVLGLEPKVARLLQKHYTHALGGAENWARIESIRFEGMLRLPQGRVSFTAFLKKPNYGKVVAITGLGQLAVNAYDGSDAWQIVPSVSPAAVSMAPADRLNFTRDAVVGGHLLYPTLPGKVIELVDTRRVGENFCHDLRVTLPNGQQVHYLIDAISFEERQQVVVNASTGEREVTTFTQMQKVDGISVPFSSITTIDGEFMHEIESSTVQVNLGVMPWMFERPSGASLPALPTLPALPSLSTAANRARGGSPDAASEWSPAFGQPRFPELGSEMIRPLFKDEDPLSIPGTK